MLLITDEVITAFGRTGRWFGLEHWGVQPDIISFAKGVTSGTCRSAACSSRAESSRLSTP